MSADIYINVPRNARSARDAQNMLHHHERVRRGYDVAFELGEVKIVTREFAQALASDLATIRVNSVRLRGAREGSEVVRTLIEALRAHGIRTGVQ